MGLHHRLWAAEHGLKLNLNLKWEEDATNALYTNGQIDKLMNGFINK